MRQIQFLLDTGVLRGLIDRDSLAPQARNRIIAHLDEQAFFSSYAHLLFPPLLLGEYIGLPIKGLPRPAQLEFVADEPLQDRIGRMFDHADQHYHSLEALSSQNLIKLLFDRYPYTLTDPVARDLWSRLEKAVFTSEFPKRITLALTIDALCRRDDWGAAPPAFSLGPERNVGLKQKRRVLVEIEHRLIAELLPLRAEGVIVPVSRRLASVAHLLLREDIRVPMPGRAKPMQTLKEVVGFRARDDAGDLEYIDAALLGFDDRSVRVFTFDHEHEVYCRIVVYRRLYQDFERRMKGRIRPPVAGRVTVLDRSSGEEVATYKVQQLPKRDIFRWSLNSGEAV